MADAETRARLYKEYVTLDNEYRKLADKLKPFELTAENRSDQQRLVDLGKQLGAKLQELQESFNVRRRTPAPGSGF